MRFGVRRALALRARRLLAEVILRTRQALGAQSDTAREAVRQAAGEHTAALTRLADLEADWRAGLQA